MTNHDVKGHRVHHQGENGHPLGLEAYKEFVHFGLTSQDINNTAIPLSLREAMTGVYYPAVEEVRDAFASFAEQWRAVPMLARTHGQPRRPRWAKSFRYSSSGSKSSCSCSTTSPFRPSSAAPRATSTPTAQPTRNRLGGFCQPIRERDAGAVPFAVHHADRALRQSWRRSSTT